MYFDMKIQYASDLRLDLPENSARVNTPGFMKPAGDVLLLAGDILHLGDPAMERNPLFDWCADNFQETIIVPGNHEYYMNGTGKKTPCGGFPLESTLEAFEHMVRPNVRYLNNMSVILGDTEVFATTLWTIIKHPMFVQPWFVVEDCERIMYNKQRLTSYDYESVFNICARWLYRALKASTASHKVVLTHHCPTIMKERDGQTENQNRIVHPVYEPLLLPLLEELDIDYWIHGHWSFNWDNGTVFPSMGKGTAFLCNIFGHGDFRPDAVISL